MVDLSRFLSHGASLRSPLSAGRPSVASPGFGALTSIAGHAVLGPGAVEPPRDVGSVDYSGGTRLKVGVQVTEVQKAQRRVKTVRAIRRSTELEGSRSTNATRADQDAYVSGTITAAELRDRVRRRYNIT